MGLEQFSLDRTWWQGGRLLEQFGFELGWQGRRWLGRSGFARGWRRWSWLGRFGLPRALDKCAAWAPGPTESASSFGRPTSFERRSTSFARPASRDRRGGRSFERHWHELHAHYSVAWRHPGFFGLNMSDPSDRELALCIAHRAIQLRYHPELRAMYQGSGIPLSHLLFPWGFLAIFGLPEYTVEQVYDELRAICNLEQVAAISEDGEDFGLFFHEYREAEHCFELLSPPGGADGILRVTDVNCWLYQPHLCRTGDPPQDYPRGCKEIILWKWPWLIPPPPFASSGRAS